MAGFRRVLLHLSLWAVAVVFPRFVPFLAAFHDYWLFCALYIYHIHMYSLPLVSSENKSGEKIELKSHKLDDEDVQREIYLSKQSHFFN